MDEMKITSKFTTNMISKIIKKLLLKKLGYDLGIQLNAVKVTIDDGKAHLHLDVDAELEKDEFTKIIKQVAFKGSDYDGEFNT